MGEREPPAATGVGEPRAGRGRKTRRERSASTRPAIPRATYRLQVRTEGGLRRVHELVPYLDELGISHLYLSPLLRARRDSTHGYDVTDPEELDPALGDESDLAALAEELARRGMGLLLDVVPNHVGIGSGENRWWGDVLEYGRASPYAGYFDIDWQTSDAELEGRVLLPFLGAPLGDALAAGDLELAFDAEQGRLLVRHHDLRFPIRPADYRSVLAPREEEVPREVQGALRAADGAERESGETLKRTLVRAASSDRDTQRWVEQCATDFARGAGGRQRLGELLARQHYRLVHWREADERINYRRFFDVTHLAALRVEQPEVFAAVHRLVLEWIGAGWVNGLRIDHVDGLWDPARYCRDLRRCAGPGLELLVVEKILAGAVVITTPQRQEKAGRHHTPAPASTILDDGTVAALRDTLLARDEELPAGWPVDGTTGYEALNLLRDLFVDPAGEETLDRVYRERTGRSASFSQVVRASKLHVLEHLLGAEHRSLEAELLAVAVDDPACGLPPERLAVALVEVLVAFPVYRTYLDDDGAAESDRSIVAAAVEAAREERPDLEPELRWLGRLLAAQLDAPPALAERALACARRAQQLTAPLMAKAVEDTAFYRHLRLVSHNEVGGDPRRFSLPVADFHRCNVERARRWPHTLLATATHDTKRGEDARLRIAVLAELAEEWEERVRTWFSLNRAHRRADGAGGPVPEPGHEYLLYQTLAGVWPTGATAADHILVERLAAYLVKAVREGKERSSWRHTDRDYEEGLVAFVEAVLDPESGRPFLDAALPFLHRVARFGAIYGLAQVALKLTLPGVPDLYRGCELWDLSLADPDNRRPVDWKRRRCDLDALASLPPRAAANTLGALLESYADGRVKLFVTARLLAQRRRTPAPFTSGGYRGLVTDGDAGDRLCAFARYADGEGLVVAVPLRVSALTDPERPFPLGSQAWGDTAITLPEELAHGTLTDAATGRSLRPRDERRLLAADLFAHLPVAVLVAGGGEAGAAGRSGAR